MVIAPANTGKDNNNKIAVIRTAQAIRVFGLVIFQILVSSLMF